MTFDIFAEIERQTAMRFGKDAQTTAEEDLQVAYALIADLMERITDDLRTTREELAANDCKDGAYDRADRLLALIARGR